MTDALLKGAILSQFLKNLAEAVLQMGVNSYGIRRNIIWV
jgi:hypothetical protein